MLLVAIGFYGVCAYATRPSTPLVTAYVNDWLSWRWIYWVNVPVALAGLAAVLRYIRPDRPPKPVHVPIDWLAVTTFVAWVVCLLFAFGWYRKWGGWTSDAFAATVVLCVALPVVLVALAGLGLQPGRAPEAAAPEPGLRPVDDGPDAPAAEPRARCWRSWAST